MASFGLLAIRLVIGLTFAGHGTQKAFGWFGGGGLNATGGFFESLGLKPGKLFAALASAGEILSGLFFALGFLTPLAAAAMTVIMLVAIWTVTGKNGYWITRDGTEYNIAIIVVAIGVALTGPGAFSVDALIRLY
jgi:putative oxidoreductase